MKKKKLLIETASAALWDNAYGTITPHFLSTGYRTPLLKYASQESSSTIAEDFLVNSYLKRDDIEVESSISYYLSDAGLQTVSLIDEEHSDTDANISLPDSIKLEMSLGRALTNRRTIREFTGDPIQLNHLSTILQAANGISASSDVSLSSGESVIFRHRTAPSGGGLYPVNIYIASFNTKGLRSGIYKYQPLNNALTIFRQGEVLEKFPECFAGSKDIFKTSSIVILLVAKTWRSLRKYGNRGLRFIIHETGSISQNIHLAVTALGLGSLDYASFYEDEIHRVLGFDGLTKSVLHSIIIGTPGI